MEILHQAILAIGVVVVVLHELGKEAHDPGDEEHVQRYLNLLLWNFVLDVSRVPVVQKQTRLIKHHKELKDKRIISKWNQADKVGNGRQDF